MIAPRALSIVVVSLFVLPSAAAAQDRPANHVVVDPAGRTLEMPDRWNEGQPIVIEVRGSEAPIGVPKRAQACRFRLSAQWHTTSREPAPIDGLAARPVDCPGAQADARPAVFHIARPATPAAALTFNLWELLPPRDRPAHENRKDALLQAAAGFGVAVEIGNASAALLVPEGQLTTAVEAATSDATVLERTLTGLESDARILTGGPSQVPAQRILTLLDEIRTTRAALNDRRDATKAAERRRQDLRVLRKDIDAWVAAEEAGEAVCDRAALRRVGGLLPFVRARSVFYDFIVTPQGAPPGFLLALRPEYPVVTEDDRLYAIVTNRTLRDHAYGFTLSVTRQSAPPPNLGAVRPTFDVSKPVAWVHPTVHIDIGPVPGLPCPEPKQAQPPIDAESLETAIRDSVLPFQERLRGNDIPVVTISTYARQTTTDKSTTKVDSGKETVVKETITEAKPVDVLKDVKYPQVRALYRFNFSTGVALSSLREPSFTTVKTAADNPDTATVNESRFRLEETPGERRTLPLFLLSTHARRVDIQEPVWRRCLRFLACPGWRALPAASFGFALTSPADNFFVGATTEVLENIHLFVGAHNGKVSSRIVLARDENGVEVPIENLDRDGTNPPTVPTRRWEFAWGVHFNINIITTLWK